MHYEFKLGYNKLDSNQRREYSVPEIDVLLNISVDKVILRHIPYRDPSRGVERNQRSIENLRGLTKRERVPVNDSVANFPVDYRYFMSAVVKARKGKYHKDIRVQVFQHDDVFNTFSKPDFEWSVAPIRFLENGIRVYHEGFSVDSLHMTYLRAHKWMHNAEDWHDDGYVYNGELYQGTQDCELSDIVHREVVDTAVVLAASSSDSPAIDSKIQRLNLTN